MKQITIIIALLLGAMTVNAQDYFIGGGLDMSFIYYPDGTTKNNAELVLSGQYDNFDIMLGIGLHDAVRNTSQTTIGVYAGRNFNRFTLGGYLGYNLIEVNYNYRPTQADMLLFGVYMKYAIFEHFKVFAFYKLGYDNNNSYSKFSDRGFGIGVTIGFHHSDKEYTSKYYYN